MKCIRCALKTKSAYLFGFQGKMEEEGHLPKICLESF